jgi:hypothetical protein
MSVSRDPDRLISAYLEDGIDELPDRAYDAVRSEIDHTRQRVVLGPWREEQMRRYAIFGSRRPPSCWSPWLEYAFAR